MSLGNLAVKNIRRNLKSYGLYIGSTVFSIIIYFTFVTLRYSEDISALSDTSRQVSSMMSSSAFVLLVFVAIFIVYSNAFFIKKRKKEVALYSLLGVRKRSIGLMLFIENMVIGLLSLIVGVGLGFLLSQLLLALLLKLMGLNLTMGLALSMDAVVHTIIVFLIIFFVTSLQGYRVIFQFKLIDLFHAEKKGEELPKGRIVSSLFGVVTLATGYWLALQDLTTSEAWRVLGIAMPIVIIALTILGSYLLFNSVLVYVLHVLKKRNSWSWRGLNLLTISQLLYRIKGNARTLTMIATLSATTITAGGAVFGMYYNAEKEVQTYTPFTFMWEGEEQEIDPAIVEFEETIESKSARVMHDGDVEMEYTVLDYSTFVTLADQLGWETQEAPDKDSVLVIDAFYDERWSSKVESVQLEEERYAVSHYYSEPIFNVMTMGGSALVLTDEAYNDLNAEETNYQAVQVQDYKNQLELSQRIASETEQFSSAAQDYQDAIESSGATLFVGSFLGLVFLVATGSIIYFKMMTEAEEDKAKYVVLHKVGVSKKTMKQSIRHQVGMIFMAPLLLGLLHGGVALLAFSNLLQMNLWVPISIWMAAYTVIYLLYYFVTVRSFKKIVLPNE